VVPGPTIEVAGQSAPAAADKTAPKLTLGALASKAKLSAFRKGLKLRVTTSEPVTLDSTMGVTPKKATISAFDLALLERSTKLTGTQTITFKPSAKLLGKPKRTFKVRLRLVATDGAGNRTTVQRTVTVTP
ncbi:MAG: hypothetical protein JHC95_09100, partial [Solirubrobacteraceae bacterium]|nr:hypothetical protein [Solirubrobacteraceae bacterium]